METTVTKKKINYTRPFVTDYQKEIMDCPQRFCCVEASTKSGKTASMIIWLLEKTLILKAGQKTIWLAPVYAQAKIAFDRMKSQISHPAFFEVNESRLSITLMTGGIIMFKSGDNPDSIYGEDYYAAVMDEASRLKEEAWIALRSTLTATRGQCKLIGNVKGRKNFFYKLCIKAKTSPDVYFYKKITAYDAVRAGILELDEIEDARQQLPENVFRELYLAEPSEDGSNPFGINHIAGCVSLLSSASAICYGVDLAKSVDFTSIIGLDKLGFVCDHRSFQKDWSQTVDEIVSLPDAPMSIDSTGAGDPISDAIILRRDSPVEKYVFTSASKQKLMEGLALAIQKRMVSFPEGKIKDQLDGFEYQYTRTGVKYSAAAGEHDDEVCSLALAWHCYQTAKDYNREPDISFT